MDSLKRLVNAYEAWVAANPETITDLETTAKWLSYFIAGRVTNSGVVSELIYSLSNILMLYNDRIIEKRSCADLSTVNDTPPSTCNTGSTCYRLKFMLTTLEYCEVFIEISARRILGVRGKWIIVAAVQMVKAAARFFILKHSMDNIITTPAIPSLNRRALIKQIKKRGSTEVLPSSSRGRTDESTATPAMASFTFQLKRSGRIVRKVEGAPPLQYRNFTLHEEVNAACRNHAEKLPLPRELLQAEYLYIAKPLIHLASMGLLGSSRQRWQPYVVALVLDLCSIRMYYKHRRSMSKQQKLELSRRCVSLLMYLMRSPFYERYTQKRLERILIGLTCNIPLVNKITGPLLDYLPQWQSTYFYMWST